MPSPRGYVFVLWQALVFFTKRAEKSKREHACLEAKE